KGDLQFVALADIAKVPVPNEADAAGVETVRRELRRKPLLHLGKVGVEPLEVDLSADLELRADRVILEVGGQQAHGRGDARVRRYDYLGNAEHSRHLRPMQRPGAAEGDQRELPRINAFL